MNEEGPHLRVLRGGAEQQGDQQANQRASQQGTQRSSAPETALDRGSVTLAARLEGILLVATEPVSIETFAKCVRASASDVSAALDGLAEEYITQRRGFELAELAGGFRLRTVADVNPAVQAYLGGVRPPRLSAAALEALAVVAYKQPVSRAQVSAIRGVNSDSVVRTLLDGGYLVEAGRDPETASVVLLATTDHFLQQLGLASLDDLPSLAHLGLASDELAETSDATSDAV